MPQPQEFDKYVDNYSLRNRIKRLSWNICHAILIRPFSLPLFNRWRICVFRLFGAKVGAHSKICASADIWAPWNLIVGQHTALGPHTIIYNPGKITLGNKVTISQYSYLCTATHDYESPLHTLYSRPIVIHDYAWVAARAFVGPGVTIGSYAIVGATASVFKDVPHHAIVGGNPARLIKTRLLNNPDISDCQQS